MNTYPGSPQSFTNPFQQQQQQPFQQQQQSPFQFPQLAQQQQQQFQQQQQVAVPVALSTPASAVMPPFGIIIPGCAVRYDFSPVDNSNNLKYTLSLSCPGDIQFPLVTIREIVFFLNSSCMNILPSPTTDHGILIYWQISKSNTIIGNTNNIPIQSTGYELLGFVAPSIPSGVFHTGWGEHEQIIELSSLMEKEISATTSNSTTQIIVTIGLSIEPIAGNTSFTSASNNPITERRLYVAKQIASDLFRFMQSFDGTSTTAKGFMTVPTNIFDRWYQRFENRFRRDPNFFLRSSE